MIPDLMGPKDILKDKQAEHGEPIVPALSARLTSEFERGCEPPETDPLRMGCHHE